MEPLNSFCLSVITPEIRGGWGWLPIVPEDEGTLVEMGFEEFGNQVRSDRL